MARVTVPVTAAVTAPEVVEQVRDLDADVTILRYPAHNVDWFARIADGLPDRLLLHADTLIYWELETGNGRPLPERDGLSIGRVVDEEIVGDLVSDVFRSYSNHYAANPALDPELALQGYREWAVRSVRPEAGKGLVLLDKERAAAIATLDVGPEHVEILLAGVLASHRRGGLYRYLLAGVEEVAKQAGRSRVVISTQAHNTEVQRAWARYGFLPRYSWETVHVMRRDLLPRRVP